MILFYRAFNSSSVNCRVSYKMHFMMRHTYNYIRNLRSVISITPKNTNDYTYFIKLHFLYIIFPKSNGKRFSAI